jgi:hypothetical protein
MMDHLIFLQTTNEDKEAAIEPTFPFPMRVQMHKNPEQKEGKGKKKRKERK